MTSPIHSQASNQGKTHTPVLKYMPQLDGLRAIAVLLVMVHHWLREVEWINFLPNGAIGVDMFFVLSGFLISQILLVEKQKIQQGAVSRGRVLKIFYLRRTLRIFPIYYLVIFAFVLIPAPYNKTDLADNFPWFLAYASNILYYIQQSFDGVISHLWSLAAEEQFYLIWPLAILLVPASWLRQFIWGAIGFSIGFKVILLVWGDIFWAGTELVALLTPSCFDAFGIGALLAYSRIYENGKGLVSSYSHLFALVGLAIFVGIIFIPQTVLYHTLLRTSISLIAIYLIDQASLGRLKVGNTLLMNPMMRYLGRISYGLYLLHQFVPWGYRQVHYMAAGFSASRGYDWILVPKLDNVWIAFCIHFLILLGVASLSWFCFEKPINQLKRHITY